MNIVLKYLAAELYLRTRGNIKTDVFNYRFAHFDEQASPEEKRKLKRNLEALAKIAEAKAKAIEKSLNQEIKLPKKAVRLGRRKVK
jgi:hypothetical protein